MKYPNIYSPFAGSRPIRADMERLGRWMSGAGAAREDEPLFEHPEETLLPAVEQEPQTAAAERT